MGCGRPPVLTSVLEMSKITPWIVCCAAAHRGASFSLMHNRVDKRAFSFQCCCGTSLFIIFAAALLASSFGLVRYSENSCASSYRCCCGITMVRRIQDEVINGVEQKVAKFFLSPVVIDEARTMIREVLTFRVQELKKIHGQESILATDGSFDPKSNGPTGWGVFVLSPSGMCWLFCSATETDRELEGWHGEEDHTNNQGIESNDGGSLVHSLFTRSGGLAGGSTRGSLSTAARCADGP